MVAKKKPAKKAVKKVEPPKDVAKMVIPDNPLLSKKVNKNRRPITHRYILESTDPLIGFLTKTGTPMVLPLRFTKFFARRRTSKTLSLVAKDDVRVFMKEVDIDG